jgi:hypothetical protein
MSFEGIQLGLDCTAFHGSSGVNLDKNALFLIPGFPEVVLVEKGSNPVGLA